MSATPNDKRRTERTPSDEAIALAQAQMAAYQRKLKIIADAHQRALHRRAKAQEAAA